jgi:hypothetical protein
MRIRLTKLTDERHRFEVLRADGRIESHELETRSTLLHDLVHYAVEVEGRLNHSFYGRLAHGVRYEEMTTTPPNHPEAMQTERIVGILQGIFKKSNGIEIDPEQSAAYIVASFRATDESPPAWLTGDLLARALARLRHIHGRWRATAFRQSMELAMELECSAG